MTDQTSRPELGPMLREARLRRGWTVDHVQVALGFFPTRDGKTYVMSRTKLDRIEDGQRALTTEEAWRFVEIYPEVPALDLLLAANAIDEEASPEFRAMIESEAARRRETFRQGGNRRRSERAMKVVSHAAAVVAAAPFGAETGQTGVYTGPAERAARAAA